jgi:hypothetical protein
MELTPEDLDSRNRVAVLGRRFASIGGARGSSMLQKARPLENKVTGLRRLFFPKSYLTSDEERHLWSVVIPFSGGMVAGMGGGSLGLLAPGIVMLSSKDVIGGGVMIALGTTIFATSLNLSRYIINKQLFGKLSASEIVEVRKDLAPEMALENAYLTLIQEALEHQELDENTQKELKSAIKAIGAAIAGMPSNANALPENPVVLRNEATIARDKAKSEVDTVIAESYIRRAEALERSAQTVERSEQVLRRTTALREELLAQTEALRLHLAAAKTQTGGEISMATISQLATSAQAVAREADMISTAKVELENYVVLGR